MIDVDRETLVPFENATRLPGSPNPQKLRRWATRGLIRNRRLVKLEWVHIGTRPYTTLEAFKRFIQRTSRNPIG